MEAHYKFWEVKYISIHFDKEDSFVVRSPLLWNKSDIRDRVKKDSRQDIGELKSIEQTDDTDYSFDFNF